ncbi:TetR/AcrR family transcriptional regulator [Nocardia sp. NPDC052278]|uniref:TetR/AcrR family transcriptional regulator n=1 Tax=unclassified Nocardia TaxID=2637762 RepID=UPI0036ABDF58
MSSIQKGPTAKQRQKSATREQLMLAARRCVGKQGYARTTIEQIAREAGSSRPNFYLHFSSKADLARAIVEDLRQRSTALMPIIGPDSLVHETLVHAVRGWIAMYRNEVDAFQLWHEASSIEPGIEAAIESSRSELMQRLFGGIPEWESVDAAARADVVVSTMFLLLDRVCYAWLVSGWPMQEEHIVDEVVRSWEDYYIPRLRELMKEIH